jgi:hypothetical protein
VLVDDHTCSLLQITPSLTGFTLRVASESGAGQPCSVSVSLGSAVVAMHSGAAGENFSVPVPSPQLWHPDSPTLYTLAINLTAPSGAIDSVGSYVGLRTTGVGVVSTPPVPPTGPRVGWDNPGGALHSKWFASAFVFSSDACAECTD